MKKLISIALAVLFVLSFAACGKQSEPQQPEVTDGYTTPEKLTESALADDIAKIFEAACDNSGKTLTPAALLGTQVVAGTNYLILCKGTAVTPDAATALYVVNVYAALDETASITSSAPLNIADFTA